jgi:hypothetical protein
MSIGFWCGAVPSSLTLPVIWPAEAALTLLPEYSNPNAKTSKTEASATTLHPAFIEFFSSFIHDVALSECAN